MTFFQLPAGYRYNSDTLYLYDFVAQAMGKTARGRLLDVGCGCGVLGLLLARDNSNLKLASLDVQPINCEIAAFNAKFNGVESEVINADFAKYSNLTSRTDGDFKFDFVVSNPPFYDFGTPSPEPHVEISRSARHLPLRALVLGAASVLAPKGKFYFCYDARFLSEILVVLDEFKFKLTALRFVYPKEGADAKIAMFEARLNSKTPVKVLPPLVARIGGEYSEETRRIFAKAATQSREYNSNLKYNFKFDPSKCEICGGKCCAGESGYIWLTPDEIKALANATNMDESEFRTLYTRKVGVRVSLIEKPYANGFACVFFEDGKCGVYEARPAQCRAFPFWDYYANRVEELEKECIGVTRL